MIRISPPVGPVRPPTFVLDPQVVVAWFPIGAASQYATDVMDRLTSTAAAVPSTWAADLATPLLRLERTGRLSAPRSDYFLAGLDTFHILFDLATPAYAWGDTLALARAYRLSVSAAAYLELARRLGVPLAAVAPPLVRAAPAAGVPIFAP